jgi:hypothetical protein
MATRHRGVDPGGARDDYEYSVKQADGVIRYTVDELVVGSDMVGPPGPARCPAAMRRKASACAGPPAAWSARPGTPSSETCPRENPVRCQNRQASNAQETETLAQGTTVTGQRAAFTSRTASEPTSR